MWETLVRVPLGKQSKRKFSRVLATFLVASFGYIFASAPSVSAADASWEADSIVYESNTYDKVPSTDDLPDDVKASPAIYRYLDNAANPDLVYFIYFATGVSDPKAAGEATYIRYTNPPNRYINPTPQNGRPITVEPAVSEEADAIAANPNATSCNVSSNVGWLVCGVGGWIAEGIDSVYGVVASFLTVQPLTTDGSSSLYNLWDVVRNFANVMFAIGFLVIIYSYLVGGGFSGYDLRKIIPRVVVAAILINISFWICSVAVDISNIIGVSLQDLLINIRENSVAVDENRNVGWGELTTYILSGGTIGALGFLAATGGSIASFGFLLLGVLITVVFALFVAFIILAARQAILIVLIVLSPLAFAAFILPNTEKWFTRWRSTFTTLLLLFPIFSLLFGGSQLAGAAIIQSAPNLAIMLFGMAVQIVPLVITPLLIQFSGGLIGRIAGIVNNPGKGMVDRSKNWTKDRQELHRQKNLSQPNTGRNNWNMARRGAQRMYAKDLARKKRLQKYEKDAETLAHDKEFGTGRIASSRIGQKSGLQERLNKQSYGYWDDQYRGADIRHKASEEHHRRQFATAVNTNPAYADLRNLQRQTVRDSSVAGLQEGEVDAAGQADFRREVEGSRALSRVVKNTTHSTRQAEKYEEIVQKAADSSWNARVRNDADTQALYLKAQRNSDNAGFEEQRLKTFVQDVKSKGSEAPNVKIEAAGYADNVKDIVLKTDVARNAEAQAKRKEITNLATAYKASAELRMKAGGIAGEAGAALVYAKAFQTMVNDQTEGTNAEKVTLGQVDSDVIFERMDDPNASVEQLAAYAGTIAGRGYHAHHIKLLGKVSQMYKQSVAEFEVNKTPENEERVAKMKDMVQQVGADQKKIAFGVRDYDHTLLGEGRYDANIYKTSRDRIMTNLSVDVMANMDPDDIWLLYEMHRKNLLTPEQSEKVKDTWNAWKTNRILSPRIQTKHRNFLDRIETDDYSSQIEGMDAPIINRYGLRESYFDEMPPDIKIRNPGDEGADDIPGPNDTKP